MTLSLPVSLNTVAGDIASVIAHVIQNPVQKSMTNEEFSSFLVQKGTQFPYHLQYQFLIILM